MKQKLLLGFIALFLSSCGVDHTDFSGDWVDKKSERDRMIIKKNGDNYIVENRSKKYPAQIKDGLLEISAELPIKATIDENDILIVAGKEYYRFEKALKPKFAGIWHKENDEKTEYKIIYNEKGSLSVDLLNNEPWEEQGHSGGKKKLSRLKYSDGNLTFRIQQKIDYSYRKWNITMNIENDKLIVKEQEINSPYGSEGETPYSTIYKRQ